MEIKIDHLSWSQIKLYLENPRGWWFKYVRYPDIRHDQNAPHFRLGTEYHLAVENMYKGVPFESCMGVFRESLLDFDGYPDLENLGTALGNYQKEIYPLYKRNVEPANLELAIEDFYIDGVDAPIHMRIDMITNDGRIIDHKTVGRETPKAANNGQGLLYAYWYYKKYKTLPRAFELHRAYKFSGKVDIDSWDISLVDVLNMADIVRSVWKMMNMGIFYWGLDSRDDQYREEYNMMLLRNG